MMYIWIFKDFMAGLSVYYVNEAQTNRDNAIYI